MISLKKRRNFKNESLRSLSYSLQCGELSHSKYTDLPRIPKFENFGLIEQLFSQLNEQLSSGDENRVLDAFLSIRHILPFFHNFLQRIDHPEVIFHSLTSLIQASQNSLITNQLLFIYDYIFSQSSEIYAENILNDDIFLPTIISKLPSAVAIRIISSICQNYPETHEFLTENNIPIILSSFFRKFIDSDQTIANEVLSFFDRNYDVFIPNLEDFMINHILSKRTAAYLIIISKIFMLFGHHFDEKVFDYLVQNNIIPKMMKIILKPGRLDLWHAFFPILHLTLDIETESFSGIDYLISNGLQEFVQKTLFRTDIDEYNDLAFNLLFDIIYHDINIFSSDLLQVFVFDNKTLAQKRNIYELGLVLMQATNPELLKLAEEFDPLPSAMDYISGDDLRLINLTLEIISCLLAEKPKNWAYEEVNEIVADSSFMDILQNILESSENEETNQLVESLISYLEETE